MPSKHDVRDAPRIPSVLPLVHVTVGPEGDLAVEVDHQSHPLKEHEARRGRDALRDVVNDIATSLDAPVRVELIEHDGTTFTDIVRPEPTEPGHCEIGVESGAPAHHGGFIPNERIDVAVVVAHLDATESGQAQIELPPSLLSNHPGHIVLLGANSGTLVVLGCQA